MIVSPGTPPKAPAPYDFIGARRSRRTFRFLAASFLLFIVVLWFSETYLRYGISETQYKMSLTLLPEQARPILRNVIDRERRSEEGPPARYLEALAFVESLEEQLLLFEEAYQAPPRSVSLLMNYGAALYEAGKFEEAREMFREAGLTPPRSILPRFLEAASLAAASDSVEELADVIALITRANASGDPVRFPAPLWHDHLPRRGLAYMQARNAIAKRHGDILDDLAEQLFVTAHESLRAGRLQDWDMWLQSVQEMGKRLFGADHPENTPATAIQMLTALRIKQESVKLRETLSVLIGGAADAALVDKRLRLESAIREISAFESEKFRLISEHYSQLMTPFRILFEWCAALLVFYAFALLIHRMGGGGKRARAAPHIAPGKWVSALGLTLLLALLLAQNLSVYPTELKHSPALWRSLSASMLCFGLAYPVLMLRYSPFLKDVFERPTFSNDAQEAAIHHAVTWRRCVGVYGSLARRYFSLLMVGTMITACGWVIVDRVLHGAYPFQLALRTTGLEQEEESLQAAVWEHLHPLQQTEAPTD